MGHSKRNKKDKNSTSKSYLRDTNEQPVSTMFVEKKPKNGKRIKFEILNSPEKLKVATLSSKVKVERRRCTKRTKKQVKNFKTIQQLNVIEDSNELDQDATLKYDITIDDVKEQKMVKNKKIIEDQNMFPEKDLTELFQRMQMAIPENDSLVYSTRLEKINWDEISFKHYTSEDCRLQWLLLQKQVRKFRLLSELIQSAKELIQKPWLKIHQKNVKHPDMPKRPLSSFMLFTMDKRNKIQAENPGLEVTEVSKIATQMYKALSPTKREKYVREAAEKRKIYEAEMIEFHRLHREPEYTSKTTKSVPKKPNTPFMLFYESELKNLDKNKSKDKDGNKEFKDLCKEKWKDMSDKKKVVYINWSLDQENKYYDELKLYRIQNPNFIPLPKKSVLTKEEKTLRERIAGKPVKPANSAYSLYSRMMLQSDEIKNINPKDRMVYIADKWKNCSDEEKRDYNDRIAHLREQYKLDFATYLETLPEEKRQEEIRNTLPKRKRNNSIHETFVFKKKIKTEDEETEISRANKDNVKMLKTKDLDNGKREKKKVSKKDEPFSKPPYWKRMRKDEKHSFRIAMLKLRKHLALKFQYNVDDRDSASLGEEDSFGEISSNSSSDESS